MLWRCHALVFLQIAILTSIPHEKGLEALEAVLEHREDTSISVDSLMELARVVLKDNFFEFDGEFYHQLRGTAIGTKCAPSYAIRFMAALEEKLLSQAQDRPWLWWRYIDDIFLIGEEKLDRFLDFLNQAHPSIEFTANWSREKINFLDVQVMREGDRLNTDLFTNPTDTHQLLTSCHPGHTKKGIPYSQALRIWRICSDDRFFIERVGELKGWLLNRSYGENGENTKYLGVQVDSQLNWDKHVGTIKTKANRALGLIKYSKEYLPSDVLNKIYRGIVEPQLSYCCSVWGCCSESKINALQKFQNRAARIVTNSSYDASAAPLIQNLGWPTISNLIRKETATLTYKFLNSLALST